MRRYIQARRNFKVELSNKKAYDAMRQAAWVAQVEYERKEEAKRQKAAEDERKKKAADEKMRKEMLEAAFDGEVGRCRLPVSRPVLKARPVSALETKM